MTTKVKTKKERSASVRSDASNHSDSSKPALSNRASHFGLPASFGQTESMFRSVMLEHTNHLYEEMCKSHNDIQDQIAENEAKVEGAEEREFLRIQHDSERQQLLHAQAIEVDQFKFSFEHDVKTRLDRKNYKRYSRESTRATKKRDLIISQQKVKAQFVEKNRTKLSLKRAAFDQLVGHLEGKHRRQEIRNAQSQSRELQFDRQLHQLKYQHLNEEQRTNAFKKYTVRENYKKALFKIVNEHLRELQLTEIRHVKENFQIELTAMEDTNGIQIKIQEKINEMQIRHMTDIHVEKENLIRELESDKMQLLRQQHSMELKNLAQEHRIALKQLKIKQNHM